jgi:hypothetical protein
VKAFKLLVVALALCALTGCIRRRVVLTSEPPGAKVTWNKVYRGRTPIDIPYIWHWKYTLDLEREGYRPSSTVVRLRARPWFLEPFEFFCEALPLRFTDTRRRHFVLEPAPLDSVEGAG